ncbi:hypothetical protein C8J55DRAFT_558331 [Lentinula edodes]|uniref:Uncharacterized protein n=1 Tax=Lentinula lateritia TaxID=40482 RepID=A0A9W9DVP0_9AGAR|nr:hypothetical protein C8J55DRAFT_558331 [Lentinula edodes]
MPLGTPSRQRSLVMPLTYVSQGNFLMTVNFVNQPLCPVGQQLNVINVLTAGIHVIPAPNQTPYTVTKSAFTALIGRRIADEHSVEDISYHPGGLYSEGVAILSSGMRVSGVTIIVELLFRGQVFELLPQLDYCSVQHRASAAYNDDFEARGALANDRLRFRSLSRPHPL